jgi:hypothetical protein
MSYPDEPRIPSPSGRGVVKKLYSIAVFILLAATSAQAAEYPSANPDVNLPDAPIAQSQRVSIEDVSRSIYEQLPALPLENQYVSVETGEINPDSTLVSRLIRYHIYTKGRPTQFRLDWKLTLADYLGANELMFEEVYPGYDNLQTSAMKGDRQAIGRLSRSERDVLVHSLVSLFNPQYLELLENAGGDDRPEVKPSQPEFEIDRPPQQPQPGDAELLNF